MKNLKYIAASVVLASCFLAGNAQAVSGGYTSAPMARMDAYSANFWSQFNFPIESSMMPSPNAKITSVNWQYALGQLQVATKGELIVYLCQGNTSTCINVSNMQYGSSTAFRNGNATIPFFLYYRVNSNSTIGTIYGSGPTQVTVNWKDD
ncbi:flagellar protein FlhE [Pectobacterium polonicum]|uniref:flagellar protein FlhE n=1 Tax=Pectobacterium polonicum TaxID=2485124 RepID=UPI002B2497A9|nr:flagellar protein FlhE [Pectobacterium polonicum]